MLPAHTGLFSHFPSLDHPSVSLYRNISEVEAFGRGLSYAVCLGLSSWPRVSWMFGYCVRVSFEGGSVFDLVASLMQDRGVG